ncbi:hypothetical protein EYF80_012683 [Liparis tanakae]|uniref:Uncharacterized protein n=1 Tax=Liparis tanakae TaxID=230148 RepID=A0A4Z2IH78_9TELE|nr:hypothetical protein EYF80_012683 [Liparis tanakae]
MIPNDFTTETASRSAVKSRSESLPYYWEFKWMQDGSNKIRTQRTMRKSSSSTRRPTKHRAVPCSGCPGTGCGPVGLWGNPGGPGEERP